MMIRNKLINSVLFLGLMVITCSFTERRENSYPKGLDFPACREIEKYPATFSYANEDLKKDLISKCGDALDNQQKMTCFLNHESFPDEIYSEFFQVFAVNKINYTTGTLVIYLIEEVQTESPHEMDRLLLVTYDKLGAVQDVLSRNLQDVFSTRGFQFTSSIEFSVIDSDSEYSPDPETEAEDRKNGRAPEPSLSTLHYEVDTAKLKFKLLD